MIVCVLKKRLCVYVVGGVFIEKNFFDSNLVLREGSILTGVADRSPTGRGTSLTGR